VFRPHRRILLLSCLWLVAPFLVPPAASGAQLILRNGDRITGEVVSRENGRITFRSPLIGEIVVAEVDAAVDELAGANEATTGPIVDSLAGLPPAQPTAAESAAPASAPPAVAAKPASPPPAATKAAPTPASAPKPAATSVAKSEPAAKPSRPPWRGKVEFGFKQQSGRSDRVDFDVRADAQRSLGRNSYRANTRVLYAKSNDRIISDRQEGSFRWRRDFSKTIFSQSLTTYYSDDVKSIDHNYEQNIGFGYRVLDRPAHIVNAGLGLTGQYRQTTNATNEGYVLGEFFEDYTYKINGRFTLTQDFLAQWSSKAASNNPAAQNYKFRFNAALQGRVTTKLSVNLRFEYEFDNAIANRNARTDQRISSSLGYAF
jgi:putative salt-induced outer membrane protein YdiY